MNDLNLNKNQGIKLAAVDRLRNIFVTGLPGSGVSNYIFNLILQDILSSQASIVIDPYGNVRACVLKSETFGNIKEKPLTEILFDKHGWEIRNSLKNCTCWSQCEMSTSLMVDFSDLVRWFLFDSDKKAFFSSLKKKIDRL